MLVEMSLVWLEDVDSQAESDLFFQDEELKERVKFLSRDLAPFFSTPEVRQWWHDEAKRNYRPSFAKKIDKYIDPLY